MDYADLPPEPEPVTTIAWRLAHLIHVLGPAGESQYEHRVDRSAIEFAGSARGALEQLDAGYESRMAEIKNLGVTGLARPQGQLSPPQFADAPIARKVMYEHVELIHHGAEICLLRDLYQYRSTGSA